METKLNPALVGAFVIVLGTLLVAVALWLGSGGGFARPVDLYLAIEDESVAGLNVNAAVKFNGVDVGQVQQISLDPKNPARVQLLFAIARGTPISAETLAVLKTQGLTGIAYVELSGGSPGAPALLAKAGELYPEIRTKPSLSARLENVLVTALAKLDSASSHLDALLSDANQTAVKSALADIAVLARTMAARKDSIDAGIAAAARTAVQAERAAVRLGPAVDGIGRAAQSIEDFGREAALTTTRAGRTVDAVGADLQRVGAETVPEVQRLLGEIEVLTLSLRRLSEQTERDPAMLLWGRAPLPPGPGEVAMEDGR